MTRRGTLDHYGVVPVQPSLTVLDVFAGAGGLSLGLSWAGFRSVGAVEFDPAAAATYELNFGHVLRDGAGASLPIEDVDFGSYRGSVDLLAGGPPCQGFSQLGRGLADDPRNRLWREYMRAVDQVRPRAFVMENVPPLLRSEEGRATLELAESLGYSVHSGVLSAELFGVPQRRKRAFIVGVLKGTPRLPIPMSSAEHPRTVRWAIGDLPSEPTDLDWHIGRSPQLKSVERYKVVPEGGNRFDLQSARPDLTPRCWLEKPTGSTDVFGRLWWDRPALTIRTEFFKPEKGRYLHPQAHRPITHREAARLQTFPDDFLFTGSKIQVARQIGNAVPPVLAYRVGEVVHSSLTGSVHESDGVFATVKSKSRPTLTPAQDNLFS